MLLFAATSLQYIVTHLLRSKICTACNPHGYSDSCLIRLQMLICAYFMSAEKTIRVILQIMIDDDHIDENSTTSTCNASSIQCGQHVHANNVMHRLLQTEILCRSAMQCSMSQYTVRWPYPTQHSTYSEAYLPGITGIIPYIACERLQLPYEACKRNNQRHSLTISKHMLYNYMFCRPTTQPHASYIVVSCLFDSGS